jgi:Asp/Glu/hydantoin racemase
LAPKTLAFVHTTAVLIPVFARLVRDKLPGVEVFHMLDESLLRNTIKAGGLTRATTRRVAGMVGSAFDGGADAVMVTCSSIGAAVDAARQMFDRPVLRVDEAMAGAAVRMGTRIGVAATLRTTLEPTMALLERTAGEAGRKVELIPRLCEGAFEAVLAGDTELHDRLVGDALRELRGGTDAVVLAQASMARVVESWPVAGAPILSSPALAVEKAREIFH